MRLRAMISSTIAGMEDDRAGAARALELLGFETLLSERAGSVAAPPETWCETAARECDVFVLLLGPDYGWTIPQRDISVVEYEFDVALASDRAKILVFLRQMSAAEVDPRQAALIERVCDFQTGHFRATPYRGTEDLAARIKADVTDWLQARLREARFAPEGVALLTARRPLRAAALEFWLVVLGAALATAAITLGDPFYRTVISWSEQLNAERVRWVFAEGGATLAMSVGSLFLGISAALGLVMLLIKLWQRHVQHVARFVSGGLAGALVPVSLVGPIWFGYGQWQVVFLGATVACATSLSRFARLSSDLEARGANELLVSLFATRTWIPAFLAVAVFTTVYRGLFIGGGLLDVWIMANRQFLEGVKVLAVMMFLSSLWLSVSVADVVLRYLARLLLVRRLAH